MRLPLAFRTAIGFLVGRLLITGECSDPKLAVLPVSAMSGAMFSAMGMGVGGPSGSCVFSGGKDTTGVQVGMFDGLASLMSLLVVVLSKHASLGFPPFHSLRGARLLRDMMMLQPPMMLSAVAVTWWPSFWRSQVMLV